MIWQISGLNPFKIEKTMEKTFYKVVILLMLHLYTSAFCVANNKSERQGQCKCKIGIMESTRGSPADSTRYSVMVNGSTNTIKINDQLIVSNSDSTNNKNKILVEGEGNTISIVRNDQESKVSVTQKGKKNCICITQN